MTTKSVGSRAWDIIRFVLFAFAVMILGSTVIGAPPPASPIVGKVIPADLSGYIVAAGDVLDLGGATVKITKPILVYGEIRDGAIDANGLAKHEGAIYFPKDSNAGRARNLRVTGGSFNGFAKVWGNNVQIFDCSVAPGTGWGVQVLGGDRGLIDGWRQQDTRRGGIYFGDGTAYGVDVECEDWVVRNVTAITSDEEAVFRANTARRLLVQDCFFDNTRSRSGKEAVQPRGREIAFERCVILGSTSSGQTPVGVKQLSLVKFSECSIYGYNSVEPGGDVTFTRSLLVHRPSWIHNGITYTLKTTGNGYPVAPQSSARGLPEGKATIQNCTVDAKGVVDAKLSRRVRQENVRKP